MKLLGIKLEYIQKHTPEDNGDIESFHNSIKTDYIGPNEFRNFNDASIEVEKAFYDYNECGPLKHSISLDLALAIIPFDFSSSTLFGSIYFPSFRHCQLSVDR